MSEQGNNRIIGDGEAAGDNDAWMMDDTNNNDGENQPRPAEERNGNLDDVAIEEDDNDDDDEEENEDSDNEEENYDEEEEEEVVEEVDEEYRDDLDSIDLFCARLRLNELQNCDQCNLPELRENFFVIPLAAALMENTSLEELGIKVWSDVTIEGAQMLVRMMEVHPKLQSLALYEGRSWDNVEEPDVPTTGNIHLFYPETVVRKLVRLGIYYDVGDSELIRLGKALRRNTRLQTLDVRVQHITQRGSKAFLKGLQTSNLTELQLYNVWPDMSHYLLSRGILTIPTLRKLSIENEFYDEDDTVRVNRNVPSEEVSHLEELSIQNCHLYVADLELMASAMKGNSCLKVLHFHENGICSEDVPHLLNIIQGASNLQKFTLREHSVCAKELEALVQAVSAHPTLQSLTLSCIEVIDGINDIPFDEWISYDGMHLPAPLRIRESCAAMLIDNMMHRGLQLEELHLHLPSMNFPGIYQLVKASSAVSYLKTIDVTGFVGIGFKQLALISNELTASNLTQLRINLKGITFSAESDSPKSKARLKAQQKACNDASHALLEAIRGNVCMNRLDIYDKDMPNAVFDEIYFLVKLNKSGRQLLRLEESRMPLSLWCHVMAKHRENASAILCLLREQPTLITWVSPAN